MTRPKSLQFLIFLFSVVLPGTTLADDGLGPTRVEIEESLVWRTRVRAEALRDWTPSGFHYGVAKPYGFAIHEAVRLPFLKQWEIPSVVEGPRNDWETEGPIRLADQPLDPLQTSDAAQFGVKVISDHVGLRLTLPTFLLPPARPDARLIIQKAQMPDAVEFRIDQGSDGSAIFSVHNHDPKHPVTFHNLRFTTSERGIPLENEILVDQTVPLAHAFADDRQRQAPPVVRPKAGFAVFRQQFPDMPAPLVVASGLDSRKFVLTDLQTGVWVYVEGFATRTNRDGHPLLDPHGLPERPSEFRYGFRVVQRERLRLDLASFSGTDSLLTGDRQAEMPQWLPGGSGLALVAASPLGSPWLATAATGQSGGGSLGAGFQGASGSWPQGGFPFVPSVPSPVTPSVSQQTTPGGTSFIPTDPTPPVPALPGDPGVGPGPMDPPSPPVPAASVPEPSTWLGGALGIAILAWWKCRYRP